MGNDKKSYNLAIVGGGRHGMAILEALVPTRKIGVLREQPLKVVGVADLDPNAPGINYANRFNLFVTTNFTDFFSLPDLDIIVNATGHSEVSQQLRKEAPRNLMVLNVDRPFFSWEDFWDLIPVELSSIQETAPLKLAIAGGGKGGYEVLQHLAGNPGLRKRIEILGVADPNPLAQGMILARSMGIPTFDDYAPLLAEDPDLVLELTGESEVREGIIRNKQPHTQIIDHIKARLFWELLRREEDRLRSKVESEIKLARQRSRFHRIFDHLPDPVLVLLSNYLVDEVNLTFLNRFQKKEAEVVGKPCYEVFHGFDEPCDAKGLACPLPRVLESCQTVQVLHCSSFEGTGRCDEITMSPLFPREAAQKRVVEVIKDITSRKQLEAALDISQAETRQLLKKAIQDKAFLETIIDGIEDHMMVIDLNYRIVEVNRALLEMVGLEREEVVGKHCYEVSHHLREPCNSPDHPCPLKDTVATGKAASAIHVHFNKDGRESYVHVVHHPLFDEEGRIVQVVDLSRDITQDITRNRMMHEDKMASLVKLSASVMHEINNPLTGILNFVKLIQRMLKKGDPDEQALAKMKNYLDLIFNETSRVSKTVSGLLPFSRKSKPEFKPVNLNVLLAETLALTGYQMRLQGITVETNFTANLLQVMADEGQMKQVFLNLLLNAQEAMPKGGALKVATRNSGPKEIIITVADDGVGIPEENIPQIFESFFTTKKSGSGVGLGLSVVQGIIRDHHGTIEVESTVGRGSKFTIHLPAAKPGEKNVAS
ncbi:MAG: PAS domain-containing protein [Deltaproteobacteria bacterium]|nr:MAG: PAS domain-containing protein [Deltaproteobacteria bacterium]